MRFIKTTSLTTRFRPSLLVTSFVLVASLFISGFGSPVGATAAGIPTNLHVSAIDPGSVTLAWDAPTGDISTLTGYSYAFYVPSIPTAGATATGSTSAVTFSKSFTDLIPGMDYRFTVKSLSSDGSSANVELIFTTPDDGTTATVTSVVLDEQAGRKLLYIQGTHLVDVSNGFSNDKYAYHPLVKLNGEDLGFCTAGTGATAADFGGEDSIYGYIPRDTPNCYFYTDMFIVTLISDTAVTVWVKDDFDLTAPGSLFIRNSAEFLFNQPTSGGETPPPTPIPTIPQPRQPTAATPTPEAPAVPTTTPTVEADGDGLTVGSVITPKPTFTGTADPFSTVTVTVHSDPVICTTTADASGHWSCTLPSDLPAGAHSVTVKIVNSSNETTQLGPYDVVVKQDTPTVIDSDTKTDQPTQSEATFPWYIVGIAAGILVLVTIIIVAFKRSKHTSN